MKATKIIPTNVCAICKEAYQPCSNSQLHCARCQGLYKNYYSPKRTKAGNYAVVRRLIHNCYDNSWKPIKSELVLIGTPDGKRRCEPIKNLKNIPNGSVIKINSIKSLAQVRDGVLEVFETGCTNGFYKSKISGI